MNPKVTVGNPGKFFCQMCAKHRIYPTRAFDFQTWAEMPTGYGWVTVTICEWCRGEFTMASLEADAAELASWRQRDPNAEEEAQDRARENNGWLDPMADHLTRETR